MLDRVLDWLCAIWDEHGPHRFDADTLRRKSERHAIQLAKRDFKVALFCIDRAVRAGGCNAFVCQGHMSDRLRAHCARHGLRIAEPQGKYYDYQIQWDNPGSADKEWKG